MSGLSAILSFRLPALWFKKGKPAFPIYPIILAIPILLFSYESFSEERVQYLKKIGEIKEGFSSEKENFFVKITGLCCDDEGNLYVADSGWNKIFKFDPNGKFIMSFGREGQGPGEFMGQKMSNHLKISFGNDGKLYVNDPGNGRLSVFTKEGKFIKSFKLPPFTYDAPVVNSKGDIYLLSKSGIKIVDRYDNNFKYKASILDMTSHIEFLFEPNLVPIIEKRKPTYRSVLKAITREDNVILVSNISLKVFVFNNEDKKVLELKLDTKEFRDDLYKNISLVKNENKKWQVTLEKKYSAMTYPKEKFILSYFPFTSLFLDKNENICLLYKKSDKTLTIIRYKMNGSYLNTIDIGKIIGGEGCINNKFDYFYIVALNYTAKIIIFKIKE